jgi:hypothetical protein
MVNLVAMPVSRKEMEKYQNMQTRQVEHATKQWEARENKVANNKRRREWIERQNNANYRNEYDRIRGELERARIPFGSVMQLRRRAAELERLFSNAGV